MKGASAWMFGNSPPLLAVSAGSAPEARPPWPAACARSVRRSLRLHQSHARVPGAGRSSVGMMRWPIPDREHPSPAMDEGCGFCWRLGQVVAGAMAGGLAVIRARSPTESIAGSGLKPAEQEEDHDHDHDHADDPNATTSIVHLRLQIPSRPPEPCGAEGRDRVARCRATGAAPPW